MNIDSATKRNPFQHLNMPVMKSNSILRDSPPFRSGGRGSKQVAAALERITDSPQIQTTEKKYAFFDGRSSPCFVRIVNEKQFGGVLVQPLRANPLDPNFYIPWDGHLWIAMRSKLHPIEMRVHFQGLEVVSGPPVMYNFLSKGRDNGFRYPMTTQQRTEQNLSNEVDDNWDVISLESGETLSAIPKHPMPMTNYHSQSHKPPGEIYIGNIDSNHTMKTPMINVRAFPPLPSLHVDSHVNNSRNNASSNDFSSNKNCNSNINVSDGVNPIDPLKTISSNLLLDKEAVVAAAVAMANGSAPAISNSDESEEFLKIFQIAYTLYKGQKASQQSQISIQQPQQSLHSDIPLGQDTDANTITPIDADKQSQTIYMLPAEAVSVGTVSTERVPDTSREMQQYNAKSLVDTDMVQTPAQSNHETNVLHISATVPPANVIQATSTDNTPVIEQNSCLFENVDSAKTKLSVIDAMMSSPVVSLPGNVRVAKRRLDLSDASPDSVSGVLISPMLTPNHNNHVDNSTNSPELINDKVDSLNKPRHKKRNVKQCQDISQESVVSNTPEQINGDLNRTTLQTATLEVGVSLPPRPPRFPKPAPKSKASEDNHKDTNIEQDISVSKEYSVPTMPMVGTKRSRKETELAALLTEASSFTVSSSSSSSRKRRHVIAEDPPPFSTTPNFSAGDSCRVHQSNKNKNNKNDDHSNNRSSRLDVGIAILDAPRYERRARVQAQQSAVKQRDAFLGSWPNRKQSAASGHWKI